MSLLSQAPVNPTFCLTVSLTIGPERLAIVDKSSVAVEAFAAGIDRHLLAVAGTDRHLLAVAATRRQLEHLGHESLEARD